MFKRLFDIALALILTVLFLPLTLILALQRIKPDVYYALNRSLWFDIKLMGKTVWLWLKMGHLKGKS